MTMTQVLYVLEVARCRNMSRAAERLFLSQSALSQQIARLEREVGYPLFARTPHGLELTPGGVRFCRAAQPAADAWQQFQQSARGDAGVKKCLRIALGSRVYSNGLFQDVVEFFDDQPQLEAAFVTEAGQDFFTALREGRIDLALDHLPEEMTPDRAADYDICDMIWEKQCVLMSANDPRRSLSAISFGQLSGCTMMSGLENSAEDRLLKDTCRKHGVTLDKIYRSDGIETVMDLVRSGKGITLGPQSFAAYYNVAAVPLTPETGASLKCVCLKSRLGQKEIPRLRDYLLAACRRRGLLRGHASPQPTLEPEAQV